MKELERLIPQDLSEWPPYAQVLYLQLSAVNEKVEAIHQAHEGANGKPGMKAIQEDHERRLKSLEALRNWMIGLVTTVVGALAVAAALAQTVWRK